MPEQDYRLTAPGDVDLVIRKSRFLGFAHPAESADETTVVLDELHRRHPKATHHVYAWRLRDQENGRISHRFDDDGEPGGTAGRPVLQVLEELELISSKTEANRKVYELTEQGRKELNSKQPLLEDIYADMDIGLSPEQDDFLAETHDQFSRMIKSISRSARRGLLSDEKIETIRGYVLDVFGKVEEVLKS